MPPLPALSNRRDKEGEDARTDVARKLPKRDENRPPFEGDEEEEEEVKPLEFEAKLDTEGPTFPLFISTCSVSRLERAETWLSSRFILFL